MLQRSDVINHFVERFSFKCYLELGVLSGLTFNAVKPIYKVAVDPGFQVPRDQIDGESFPMTSDAFFDKNPQARFDIIFIDGLHTFEQSLRDFTRAIFRLSRNGLILIDDCFPSDYLAALRDGALCSSVKKFENYPDRNWMGDVFKTVLFIHDFFDNVCFAYIRDTMGIVAVWFEPRLIEPRFSTVEDIARCEYAHFRHEVAAILPIKTLEEIENSMHSSHKLYREQS